MDIKTDGSHKKFKRMYIKVYLGLKFTQKKFYALVYFYHLCCVDKIKMFSEFSTRTSIHGLRYVGERKRMLDIIFWSGALTIAFIFCIILILDIWASWKSQPIMITHDGTMIDVKDVPFPAITICPLNKLPESDALTMYEKVYEIMKTENCTLSEEE